MSKLIKKELNTDYEETYWTDYEETYWTDYEETYWTDSKVIFGYINNEVKRFKIFVTKRVQTIKETQI